MCTTDLFGFLDSNIYECTWEEALIVILRRQPLCMAPMRNTILVGSCPRTKGYWVQCHLSIFICTFRVMYTSAVVVGLVVCAIYVWSQLFSTAECWHKTMGTYCTLIHQNCHHTQRWKSTESALTLRDIHVQLFSKVQQWAISLCRPCTDKVTATVYCMLGRLAASVLWVNAK